MSSALSLRPLAQQVIVVTGASSGIGMATVLTAARKGAKVVLAARSDETLSSIVRQIAATGGTSMSFHVDVTDRAQLERLADETLDRFGRIDTWVNNAGVSIYGRLDQVSEADSRRLFDVNFWGIVNGSLVALQHLRTRGGAIINLGSEASEEVLPLQGMYCASKHAVKGFTDALRVEIEEVDHAPVSITLIQPTAVDTPYPEHARNYMDREPKLPDPMIDPQRVADAILDAACHHRRDVKVGMQAKLNTLLAKLAPQLADKMAARYVDRQQREDPPMHPEGTLDEPGQSGRVHGRGAPRGEARRPTVH